MKKWPEGIDGKAVTKEFIATYRAAFDADPTARFAAGEVDGITLIVAVGYTGQRLQLFVENNLRGVVQRPRTSGELGSPPESVSSAQTGARVGGNEPA